MKWEAGKTYAWKDVKDANQFFKWYDVDYLKYLRLPFKVASVDAKKDTCGLFIFMMELI